MNRRPDRLVNYIQLIGPHLHRWKRADFQIRQEDSKAVEEISAIIQNPAPQLEHFRLSIMTSFESPRCPHVNLFQGCAGNLKELHLTRVRVPWDSAVFDGLRALSITFYEAEDGIPNMRQVIQILERSPNVQVLSFGTIDDGTLEVNPEPVTLPELRNATLTTLSVSAAHAFISRVYAPSCSSLRVFCQETSSAPTSSLSPIFIHFPAILLLVTKRGVRFHISTIPCECYQARDPSPSLSIYSSYRGIRQPSCGSSVLWGRSYKISVPSSTSATRRLRRHSYPV